MLNGRFLWRDWRGGELGVLFAALTVAVAIVTAIALFADRLQSGVVQQSKHFLAADNVLRSPRPVEPQWLQMAKEMKLATATTLHFQSMVYAGDSAQLASILAADDNYPLRGTLEIAEQPFAPGKAARNGPQRGEVWLDSRLFPLLGVAVGDQVQVGELSLRVAAVAVTEPDRGSSFYQLGPRLLMNLADIPATQVIMPGSRMQYRYLFAGDGASLQTFYRWLQPQLQPSHRWLTLADAQPRIASALERAKRFLLLAGALGVALAGVAIALAARRYSERHFDHVAIMKSLGAGSRQILSLYSVNILLLAITATVAGCCAGWFIQQLFVALFRDYFDPAQLPPLSIQPFFIGLVTALVCTAAFAVPPLLSLQKVSPLRVLRRDLPSNLISMQWSAVLGALGIFCLMYWYSRDIVITAAVASGIVAIVVVVGAAAYWLLARRPTVGMHAGGALSLALASLRRRGLFNAVQIVIFALATMLLLVIVLVRTALLDEWRMQLPEGTPNHFLINIADHQVSGVAKMLEQHQLKREHIYPLVRGRLTQINGEQVRQRVSKDNDDGAGIDRELNLTWSSGLPSGNVISAGSWWPAATSDRLVSVERQLAERLSIAVGDTLEFQIGGVTLSVVVASIRELDWDTMKPNFYMVFPPAVLKEYPASYITSFYLPDDKKVILNQLLRDYPTISVIAMDAIINQIRQIVEQITQAIEVVLALIFVSAVLVLTASVRASLDSRLEEGAILRALGAKKTILLGSLVLEFAAMGLLAGLFAVFGAEISTWIIQTRVLDMPYQLHPLIWLVGPLFATCLIAAMGYLNCRQLVKVSPIQVLREL